MINRRTPFVLPVLHLLTNVALSIIFLRPACAFAPPATLLVAPTTYSYPPGQYQYLSHRSSKNNRQPVVSLAASKEKLAIAGKIAPFLSKFAIDGAKASQIGSALRKSTNLVDLVVIAFVGWFSQPLVRFVYEKFIEKWRKKDFDKTYLFYLWKLASEAARIAALVYAVDCLDIVLSTLGMEFAKKWPFGDVTASVVYTAWIGRKLSTWKKIYLRKQIKKQEGGNKSGKFFLYNRIFDVIITIGTALAIADRFSISTGKAFGSFFALGSVGTLVLSLAAKGIAEQFIGGLALSTTDKFFENDLILLGDGTSGKVKRIGWMSTDLRKSDETVIRIPNGQIASQRITNISRTRYSQVQQTLRFKYSDIDKIPQLIADIKKQVKLNCPKLITDGSRPCRVHWREFQDDHIEVGVDFHFRLPPIGDVYHDNRQQCNLAIAKAMKKNDVEFAIPTSVQYEYSTSINYLEGMPNEASSQSEQLSSTT